MHLETCWQVVVVDEFTGRPVEGRSWSDGLQQAILGSSMQLHLDPVVGNSVKYPFG